MSDLFSRYLRAFGAIQMTFPRAFDRFDQLFSNRLQSCILMRKSAWAALGGYTHDARWL